MANEFSAGQKFRDVFGENHIVARVIGNIIYTEEGKMVHVSKAFPA